MNIQGPRHHYSTGPWKHKPREAYQMRKLYKTYKTYKSGWRYLFPLIALLLAIGTGYALAAKAIPQAAYDAVNHGDMR